MVKRIRWSLIGLIVLVLLAVAFNYIYTWYQRARSVQKAARILSSDMLRSFDRIEYTEYADYQKTVPRFKLSARRGHEDREGRSFLEEIEAYDFNPDGSVRNEIRSRKAEYDKNRKLADFTGDVRLFLGKGVELRMHSLHYDFSSRTGTTEDKLEFITDAARGSARGARFDQNHGFMDFKNEVDFALTTRIPDAHGSAESEKFHASSNRAFCTDQLYKIVFQGKARIESESSLLSGDDIEAYLGPERKALTSLIAIGNAQYRSGDSAQTQALRGDRMVFNIGASQTLEKISVTGQAEFLSSNTAGEQVLRGGEIDLEFDAVTNMPGRILGRNGVSFSSKHGGEQMQVAGEQLTAAFISGTGNLESIHVEKQASMLVRNDAEAMRNELRAADIRIGFRQADERMMMDKLRAEGSVRWLLKPPAERSSGRREPARTLTASVLEMFYSKEGDFFESGTASGGVEIRESGNESGADGQTRRMSADLVRFHFFPGNNRLREMEGEGHVRLIQEKKGGSREKSGLGSFRTSSEMMKVVFSLQQKESAVESMAQWGSFRYEDASMTATAGRCDYDARKKLLTLRESPQISNDRNSTTGKWMEYEQRAGVLSVHGRVRSLLSAGKDQNSIFYSSSSSSPAIVTADEMKYWTADRRARYSGKVQLLSENGQLQAGWLGILESGESVEAGDGIRHYFIPEREESKSPQRTDKNIEAQSPGSKTVIIHGSSLNYLRKSNTINYQGAVTAHSGDIDMASKSLEVRVADEGGSIEHAVARGNVIIRQGARVGKGDRAEYFLDQRKFVLFGNLAEFSDPERGRSFGSQLTYFIADDRILLESR
ncbi:MAG: LPS export ABC transporter periplasmic protein LptC [Acidobacteria bacterium]|nr:LPS export ABC transporter periplasmic protein LptC [Acidobacteriota bacterium]